MTLKDSLIANNSISLQAEAKDWKEAVRLGTDLLEKAGVVDKRYYGAILDGTAKFGPYYLLAPGLAMPHGRPEEGVLKNGFALVVLKEPVVFGDEDNDPIDILITLAAVDQKSHNEGGIVQVVNLFEDEDNFDRLRAARSHEEVIALIEKAEADAEAA